MKTLLLIISAFSFSAFSFSAPPLDDVLKKLSAPDRLIVEEALNDVRRDTAAQLQVAVIAQTAAESKAAEQVAAVVAKYQAVIDKLTDPNATKDDAKAEAEKSEKARELEKLRKEKSAFEEQAAKKQSEIDAIEAAKAAAKAAKAK
jgi:hypothetical protein